jgi:peptidoglycan hydrolase CwlO-like protein
VTQEAMDTAIKVLTFLFGIAVSVVSSVFAIGRMLGKREQEDQADRKDNATAHNTLDLKIQDVQKDISKVEKSATRAHERIDDHAVKLGMLNSNGQSLKERMDNGFGEINANIRELREIVIARLGKGA